MRVATLPTPVHSFDRKADRLSRKKKRITMELHVCWDWCSGVDCFSGTQTCIYLHVHSIRHFHKHKKVGYNGINANFIFPYICSFQYYLDLKMLTKCEIRCQLVRGSAQGDVCLPEPTTHPLWTEWQTRVKTLPCSNYVEDSKNQLLNLLFKISSSYYTVIGRQEFFQHKVIFI